MSLVTVRRVRLLLPVSCVCACLSRPQRVSLGRATCTDAMENSARAFGSQLVCRKRVNINILISLLIFFFCFSWECDAPGVNACATSMRTRHAPRTSLVRGFGRGFELCSTRADPPLLNSSGGAPPSERRWMESCKNQRSFAPALSPNFLCRMTQNVTPLPASLSPPPPEQYGTRGGRRAERQWKGFFSCLDTCFLPNPYEHSIDLGGAL